MVRRTALACLALLCLSAAPAHATEAYPPGFEQRTVVGGLTQTVALDWTPDGTTVIAEKPGRVKLAAPGSATATLLLDLSDHVNEAGDRGLEGVAVDSDFANNGFVYLAYVYESSPLVPDSTADMTSRVTRIRVDPATLALMDPGSPETTILGSVGTAPCPPPSNTVDCIPADQPGHMIGTVRSAPDGTLWVGSGDSANFGGVDLKALRTLDERSLAGKVMHVGRDGRGLPGHGFCPQDADLSHVCTKVHAKGFRNPYRFHLRPGGGLSVADVGWNTREEINLVKEGGKSFGWPCWEGTTKPPGYRDTPECEAVYAAGSETAPDYEYGRDVGGSVIGGPTYTGTTYPAGYRGSIFFGDYTGRTLRRLVLNEDGAIAGTAEFATEWLATDIEMGPGGDLWYAYFGTGAPGDGEIRRVVYTPGNASPQAHIAASPSEGKAPLTVAFKGSGSTDPDGDPLSYRWDFGDGSPTSEEADPTHTYESVGNFTATLTVSDGRGLDGTTTRQIASGGTRPAPAIATPADDSPFRAGEEIALSGSATDAEEGPLPSDALSWRVTVRHLQHEHPLTELSGAQAAFTASRDHDADFSYVITLTAEDSTGLSASRTIEILPETAPVVLTSTPAGAPLGWSGRELVAPHSGTGAVGSDVSFSADPSFLSGGRRYWFVGWSDGGARLHDVRIPPGGLALEARYYEDKAAGRPASATESLPDGAPGAAVDGDPGTAWRSPPWGQPAWQVDLGGVRSVDRVQLDWAAGYSPSFRVFSSRDGVAWSQVAAGAAGGPGPHEARFETVGARHVRVEADRPPGAGVELREARVLGPADPRPSPPPAAPPADDPAPALDRYARAVLRTRGLLAYLRMDDPGHEVTDIRGRIRGRLRGNPRGVEPLVPQTSGGALALDGSGDRAELGARGLGGPAAVSVEVWLRPARGRPGGGTIAWWGGTGPRPALALALDGRGRPRLVVSVRGGRALAPGPALRAGRTRHLVGTFDGARLRLYVDGRLRGFANLRGRALRRPGARLLLGARPLRGGGARSHLRGTLDEVALYATALRASTVRAHHRAGR